jgi:hypothetical protein
MATGLSLFTMRRGKSPDRGVSENDQRAWEMAVAGRLTSGRLGIGPV